MNASSLDGLTHAQAVATLKATINVNRNPNGPVFTNQNCRATLNENVALGTLLINNTATDNDGVWYFIESLSLYLDCPFSYRELKPLIIFLSYPTNLYFFSSDADALQMTVKSLSKTIKTIYLSNVIYSKTTIWQVK